MTQYKSIQINSDFVSTYIDSILILKQRDNNSGFISIDKTGEYVKTEHFQLFYTLRQLDYYLNLTKDEIIEIIYIIETQILTYYDNLKRKLFIHRNKQM